MFSRLAGDSKPLVVIAALLVLGGICALVLVLVGQFLSEGRKQLDYYQALERSLETRTELRRLSAVLQDAEVSQRSFLLTGRPEFLDQYEQVSRQIPGHLQALERGLSGIALGPAVHRLAELVPAVLNELTRAITTYQQSGPAAAAAVVAEERARAEMDEIRATVAEALYVESRNVAHLSAGVQEQAANAQLIILILFGGIILMVLAAAMAGIVYLVNRLKSERALRNAWRAAETAQQQAEEASRAKSEFLATMSHEIRTPLHSVIGSAEILLEDHELAVEQREYLERIQVSGTALLNLVNDVLDLAKIEAGEIEIAPEPFSLEALIDNSISIVRTTALGKGLNLTVVLDHNLPLMLLADESRLRQILLNLLGNAVKFTDHGEVTLRVENRGSTQAGEILWFSVTDTGPGIPAHRRERLFQRFSQISQSVRRSGGTGLGLAISKQLVELMGGEMGFESTEGQGSTFWFSLTLPQVEAEAFPQIEMERSAHETSGRLLVVDDLDQNRDLAQKMLEAAGYTVDLVTNGAAAVAAVQATTYDLVLMDIQMDGMDGVTATKIIRGLDHPAKNVPIVAMTANVLAHDVKSYKAIGMTDHLGKPFKRRQLLDKVRHWLHTDFVNGLAGSPNKAPESDRDLAADQKAIEELCSTMGREWVVRGLTELKDQLELTFKGGAAETADCDALARQTHRLVSRAGILGFAELAQLCSAVEQACKRGEAPAPLLSQARSVAIQVQTTASQLLQKLQAQTPGAHSSA